MSRETLHAVKLATLVALVVLSLAGCTHRNGNLEVRYTGLVLLGGGAGMMVEAPLIAGKNGSADRRLIVAGAAVATVGLALLIGSLLELPAVRANEAIEAERLRKYQNNLQAVELFHQAEAAAAASDCDTLVVLAPRIDALDPGVGEVLRRNVAAARCLVPQKN